MKLSRQWGDLGWGLVVCDTM